MTADPVGDFRIPGRAYPAGGPPSVGLDRSIMRAARSRFFRRKLAAAGIEPGQSVGWDAWLRIPPTTKDELRALDRFEAEVAIAAPGDIAEYWRSGGVTGRPLFYPRTRADIAASLDAFATAARVCSVRPSDVFLCSLPIGVHPAGQQMVRAVEQLGAATVWCGAGNQTPAASQLELIHDLGVTVWCGMASFGLHLAHLAEAAGRPLAPSRVHTVITTAEPLSGSKRELLERLWGARVRDMFGMSEITLMAAECGMRPGLHAWREHSFCEVLDPETFDPVADGDAGILCVTPVRGGEAVPFLRWLSGDVVRLAHGCDCDRVEDPRLLHAGRTLGFFKIKGVNVNHIELEEALYDLPGLEDFRVSVTPSDQLVVEIESSGEDGEAIRGSIDRLLLERFGLRGEVRSLPRGTIVRSLEGEVKAQRFVDQRTA